MTGSGRPVWEDTAPREDLAALEPGVPDDWDATPDVLVVGGGVIGLGVGVFCRRAGMRVLLVEQGRLACGPSGRAAGGLSPDIHLEFDSGWRAIARRSLDLHRELDAEWGYGVRNMDLIVRPDLVFPGQAHLDPLRLAAALARRAGTVASGVTATDFECSAGRVVRVHTSNGPVTPDVVVFATGTAPSEARAAGQSLVKGHLIGTEPAPFRVDGLLVQDALLVVQLPDGRLVAGGTQDLGDEGTDIDARKVDLVRDALVRAVPEAGDLEVTHAWCCFRPHTPDDLPVIDRLPELDNAWVAAGLYTTGLLMAPAVGEALARWITTGEPFEGAESYTLARAALRA